MVRARAAHLLISGIVFLLMFGGFGLKDCSAAHPFALEEGRERTTAQRMEVQGTQCM